MQRAIDLRGAVAINVITMIGIGPLITIPLVLAALGGPLALLAWVAGAVLALCDGLVWAELSSRYPGSGGTYVYLREAFGRDRLGRAFAFLFNWQYLLFAPCVLASGYIGLANYSAYLVPAIGTHPYLRDAVAIGAGLLTIAMLYRRTSQVAALGTLLGVLALGTLAIVAAAAFAHPNFHQAFSLDAPVTFGTAFLAGFGTALYITIYDYVGYAEIALVGDEVVAPARTIPLAILLSVVTVAALYVTLQIGILAAVPWRSLLDAHGAPTDASQYIGSLVVEHAWGRAAAIGATVLVLITAVASLYGNLLGASRIPFAAARDNAFIPAFARLHPRWQFPNVSLLALGGLSIVASFFTLDQVIAFLTAGLIVVALLQMLALVLLRRRDGRAPFSMPLYPLPLIVDVVASVFTFWYTGSTAIALGIGWLLAGFVVFLIVARAERWWPFAAAVVAGLLLTSVPARAAGWADWHASAVVQERGYPVFTADGKPFFPYGAAFFYERMPREQWEPALEAYKHAGINTIDLYVIWNWHQPRAAEPPDFTGATDPRRDLVGLLRIVDRLGFKVVLRPGPVIRNEWRNGGYPDWLLERPEYDMPLHDVLEGRYPATATLQNAHADSAAAEWLANATHLRASSQWLAAVLGAVAPYAGDVIAIALDDDQGAYIDNDTWPAPHWHAYVDWLRLEVQRTAGARVPLFVNTFEMKVPAASPAWAWGDWYQSDAYAIGTHDLAQLDFATGLLQTQPHQPVMQAEFQAGWLQGADEGAPRPADPANTALALAELLRDGTHGVVNFPLQDTIYPAGWEAPWANWSYAWDAAYTVDLARAQRFAPTAAFGAQLAAYGSLLARTHVAADAAIVWPVSLFDASAIGNADVAGFADATMAAQRQCAALGLTCDLVDLAFADDATLRRYPSIVLPIALDVRRDEELVPTARRRLDALRRSGRLSTRLPASSAANVQGGRDATLLAANDGSYGFVVAINASESPRRLGPLRARIGARTIAVSATTIPARSSLLLPLRVRMAKTADEPTTNATPPPFAPGGLLSLDGPRIHAAFAPDAGARFAELSATPGWNAASSVGLLRDAVDPAPPVSPRDYIGAYTHPLAAGTFNRPYDCAKTPGSAGSGYTCSYDTPDLPDAGGARFSRTMTLASSGTILVHERYAPHAGNGRAHLQSVSGFAFAPGDKLVQSPTCVAIVHGGAAAFLGWNAREVAAAGTQPARGARLVTLTFSGDDADLELGVADYPGTLGSSASPCPPLSPTQR